MVELILIEILAVPADRSRGKHRPRVVKRKMSSFPTKSRAGPVPRQVFHYGRTDFGELAFDAGAAGV